MRLFLDAFAAVTDPRAANRRHALPSLLFAAFCAMLCGARDVAAIARWTEANLDALRKHAPFPHGAPGVDTFERVFRALDDAAFRVVMGRLCGTLSTALDRVVAIDGKVLRRSMDGRRKPVLLVQAVAAATKTTLAMTPIRLGDHEASSALSLLALLDLSGRTLTADAVYATRPFAAAALAAGADYVVALKRNCRAVHADVRLLFAEPATPRDVAVGPVEHDHGRTERRSAHVVHDVAWLAADHRWPGLAAVAMVVTERWRGRRRSEARRYFLLSRPMSAREVLATVRAHWSIEVLHRILDVDLGEDAARTRKAAGPVVLAGLRRIVVAAATKARRSVSRLLEGNRSRRRNVFKFLATFA